MANDLASFNPRPSAKDGRSGSFCRTTALGMFQSSPVREGRALPASGGKLEGGQRVSILARPRRTGALVPRTTPLLRSTGFNPRPSAKDGRSRLKPYRAQIDKVSILARPRRTGALIASSVRCCCNVFQSSPVREGRALAPAATAATYLFYVSILARPRRTGALVSGDIILCLVSFNPRPSAKDGRSPKDITIGAPGNVFQSSPVREGRALQGPLPPTPRRSACFNPRPSAKDGRSDPLKSGQFPACYFANSANRQISRLSRAPHTPQSSVFYCNFKHREHPRIPASAPGSRNQTTNVSSSKKTVLVMPYSSTRVSRGSVRR